MSVIQQLDEHSVHRLTSGQVIVDIPTAVKELVENSLDAHATAIEVKFRQYGVESFEVIDNGDGIEEADFESTALKHHTSKLRIFSDLESVATYGFRGEALNSLCAVSALQLTTCTASSLPRATKLEYDPSGRIAARTTTAGTKGTAVLVSKLFEGRLPVRRMELVKNAKREFARCVSLLQAYGIVKTNVRIVLSNVLSSGKKTVLFATKGNSSIGDNIINIFGAKAFADIVPFSLTLQIPCRRQVGLPESDLSVRDVLVTGFISKPDPGLARNTSDRQLIYINSRPCSLPSAVKAFNECYKAFNPTQFPFVVADFIIPFDTVDINVSPDKRTILLHDESVILQSLKTALANFLDSCGHSLPIRHSVVPINDPKSDSDVEPSSEDHTRPHRHSTPSSVYSRPVTVSERTSSRISSFSSSPITDTSASNRYRSASSLLSHAENRGRPSKRRRSDDATQSSSEIFTFVGMTQTKESLDMRSDAPETTASDDADRGPREVDPTLKVTGLVSSDDCFGGIEDQLESASQTLPTQEPATPPAIDYTTVVVDKPSPPVEAGFDGQRSPSPESTTADDAINLVEDYSPSKKFRKKEEQDRFEAIDARAKRHYTHELITNINTSFEEISRSSSILSSSNTADTRISTDVLRSEVEEGEQYLQSLNIAKSDFSKMKIIGQFNLGFIIALRLSHEATGSEDVLAKGRYDLFIIDQHASDEKYNFERLQRDIAITRQPLVVPRQLSLTPLEELLVLSNLSVFTNNGFVLAIDETAAAGEKCSLTGVPVVMSTEFGLDDFYELLHAVRESPGTFIRCSKLRRMLAMRACRSSVMIGTSLTEGKMRAIVDGLGTLDKPWNCPHGRPTMRHLVEISKLVGWVEDGL